MANGICDICGIRPATVRAQVVSDGQRQTMELCDVDYRRLARQQERPSSPLEALFGRRGGSMFDDFFNEDFFGRGDGSTDVGQPRGGQTSIPGRRGAARGQSAATDITERLSTQADEILQKAAREAAEAGCQRRSNFRPARRSKSRPVVRWRFEAKSPLREGGFLLFGGFRTMLRRCRDRRPRRAAVHRPRDPGLSGGGSWTV
jgi:hypothetical protein